MSPRARGRESPDEFVEHASRRPDERPALFVLLIAGLFADQHDERMGRSFTGYDLRRFGVERAASAPGLGLVQAAQACDRRGWH